MGVVRGPTYSSPCDSRPQSLIFNSRKQAVTYEPSVSGFYLSTDKTISLVAESSFGDIMMSLHYLMHG